MDKIIAQAKARGATHMQTSDDDRYFAAFRPDQVGGILRCTIHILDNQLFIGPWSRCWELPSNAFPI
jgi:hypothetical protein